MEIIVLFIHNLFTVPSLTPSHPLTHHFINDTDHPCWCVANSRRDDTSFISRQLLVEDSVKIIIMTDHTEPNVSATQNASQEEDTNDGEGTPSANKKPRIDNGETPENDVIVIDDTPSVPPPSSTADEAMNNDNAVQIKQDPGGATAAAATTADDDLDIEIISPSRLKNKNNKPSRNDNNNLEDNDEEIQITSSTLTAPNVDFPHHRSNCGVHVFTPSSTNSNSDNVKFCPNCYCLVCDVPASECKEWNSDVSNPTVGPHCHAHEKDEKWSNLLKAKRNNAANNSNDAAAATSNRPPPRNPYQRNSNSAPSHTSSNHQQIEQLIHNEFLSRLATDNNTNTNGNSNKNREEQTLRKVRQGGPAYPRRRPA